MLAGEEYLPVTKEGGCSEAEEEVVPGRGARGKAELTLGADTDGKETVDVGVVAGLEREAEGMSDETTMETTVLDSAVADMMGSRVTDGTISATDVVGAVPANDVVGSDSSAVVDVSTMEGGATDVGDGIGVRDSTGTEETAELMVSVENVAAGGTEATDVVKVGDSLVLERISVGMEMRETPTPPLASVPVAAGGGIFSAAVVVAGLVTAGSVGDSEFVPGELEVSVALVGCVESWTGTGRELCAAPFA